MALVLIDPIAGATFMLSKEPILNRGRIDTEFVAEVIDSVGLPGNGQHTPQKQRIRSARALTDPLNPCHDFQLHFCLPMH